MTADNTSTVAGAGAGFLLLSRVDWNKVVGGETTLAAVALLIIAVGYFAYRSKSS